MRSIWNGAISFGLVTIPVRLYAATEQGGLRLHQVHRSDGGRIRYKRVCEVCGEEVAFSEIAKGYDVGGGEVVVLTDEDLAELPLETNRAIDVQSFVPLEQVDPIYFDKSYYVEPGKGGAKPYVLLREALEQSGRVAIVKVALRQRESLATLRVRDGVFVLETMLWPEEVRAADLDIPDEDVRPQELKMASSLIDSMSEDFDPSLYHDEYAAAMQRLVDAKVEGREVTAPAAPAAEGAEVVDLVEALRRSVEAAKTAGRSPKKAAAKSAPKAAVASAPKPAKKAAAKAASKSAAAKPAKKSATARRRKSA